MPIQYIEIGFVAICIPYSVTHYIICNNPIPKYIGSRSEQVNAPEIMQKHTVIPDIDVDKIDRCLYKVFSNYISLHKKICYTAFIFKRAWKYSPSPLVACLLTSLWRSRLTISSRTSPSPLINLCKRQKFILIPINVSTRRK